MNRLACILILVTRITGAHAQCPFAASLKSTGGCVGDTLSVSTKATLTQVVWLRDNLVDHLGSTADDTVYRPSQPGDYSAAISDDNGCTVTVGPATIKAIVNNIPVRITAAVTSICQGDTVLFYASASGSFSYQWLVNGAYPGLPGSTPVLTGEGTPQLVASGLTDGDVITCRILDDASCDGGVSNAVRMSVTGCSPVNPGSPFKLLKIPGAFTPNGDGRNDVFYVLGSPEGSRINDFSVFNRWGQKVFHRVNIPSGDPFFGWNGYYGGHPAMAGTYLYSVTLLLANGSTHIFRGTVTLIK